MKNNIFWPVVVINAVVIICFTVLAILFHHWWIVLFAFLFQYNVKDDKED